MQITIDPTGSMSRLYVVGKPSQKIIEYRKAPQKIISVAGAASRTLHASSYLLGSNHFSSARTTSNE